MGILLLLCVSIMQVFASWTLAYHLALLFHLPARMAIVPFVAILLPLLACVRRDWVKAFHSGRDNRRFAAWVLLLAMTAGAATTLVHNYNPDDYHFFHRALVQLDHLDQPFLMTETGHNPPGLPQLSTLHAMTSYEPGAALAARLVGLDPLGFFQNGVPILGVLLMTTVLALLYRQFRLGPWMTLGATFAAIFFMIADVRRPRSIGLNLLYCWNGKVLLWGVLLPWSIVLALRFLRRPRLARLAPLFLAGVCAPGLTGSGLFLFPGQIACVALAYFFSARPSWRRFRRAALVNAGSLYCLAIVALGATGAIAAPENIDAWTVGWPSTWLKNLSLIFSSGDVVVRDLLLVFLLPWFALRRPFGRLALLVPAALILLVANPLCGPLWLWAVKPGAYWRFAFLVPLAWYAGLIVPALWGHGRNRLHVVQGRFAASVAIAAVLVAAGLHCCLWRPQAQSGFSFKSPGELRLPRPELALARLSGADLQGRYILGPEDACIAVALLQPTARFHAIRGTEHVLTNAGLPAEGVRRIVAQRAVTLGEAGGDPAELRGAVQAALASGIDAVILVDRESVRRLVLPLLEQAQPGQWRPAAATSGYALFLRTKPASPPTK